MAGQKIRQLLTLPLMNLHADHKRRFIPFRLKRTTEAGACGSILGEPPQGVLPARIDEKTQYFATLNLMDGIDVSLFITFDYQSEQGPFDFFAGTYVLHDQSSPLVQFVVHQRVNKRDSASVLKSESSALGFVFGTPGMDPECLTFEALGDPGIYTDHKIGGVPSFSQLEGDVVKVPDLLCGGHVHLLQLNMPSAATDTLIHGMWPFGESTFHIFSKKVRGDFEFRYIWA